eukprot:2602814-Pleurochrysis_carterae.AAC.1
MGRTKVYSNLSVVAVRLVGCSSPDDSSRVSPTASPSFKGAINSSKHIHAARARPLPRRADALFSA